jgi:type II secretion system protein C
MIDLSNSYHISLVTKILGILLVTKAFSLVLLWILPDNGVELNLKESYKQKYQRVDFRSMVKGSNVETNEFGTTTNINNMILKGIYGTKSMGFAIVARKSSPSSTKIIGMNEEYLGYKLKSIISIGAIFTKNSKKYILKLEKLNIPNGSIKRVRNRSSGTNVKMITKKDINHYIKNPTKLWKQISMQPVKNGKAIQGFKVTRVLKDSKIEELGIRKNDIIIKANNVELNSLKSVTDFYANIKKLKVVEIVVLRDNQEKEFVYEIN